jgi:rRNA-processing protein FCF1
MKVLMDADCLIKLTKAGLKEDICQHFQVMIPAAVEREVVEAGKAKGCPDADSIEKNIQKDLLQVTKEKPSGHIGGDQALVEISQKGRYDMVATDDAKLIRILRSAGIPFIIPGLLIYSLFRKGGIGVDVALNWLERLSPFVSNEEYSTVRLLLEERR